MWYVLMETQARVGHVSGPRVERRSSYPDERVGVVLGHLPNTDARPCHVLNARCPAPLGSAVVALSVLPKLCPRFVLLYRSCSASGSISACGLTPSSRATACGSFALSSRALIDGPPWCLRGSIKHIKPADTDRVSLQYKLPSRSI